MSTANRLQWVPQLCSRVSRSYWCSLTFLIGCSLCAQNVPECPQVDLGDFVSDREISAVALFGYAFYKQTPNQHPFSLSDPSISYPYTEHETVTTSTLILVSVLAPAAIVLIGALAFVPGTAAPAGIKPSKSHTLRRKLWEWNAGWMGLGVALAGVWMSTQGLKVLIGKPRPDLLARCNPNLDDIATYAVGGLGEKLSGAATLVSYQICQDQSSLVTVDGFSSFPSGHSSCMLRLQNPQVESNH